MPVRVRTANQLLNGLIEESLVLRNFLLQIVKCGGRNGIWGQIELNKFGIETSKEISDRLYT